MSRVHGKAGNTGWTQSISCDFCPAKVERKGTGEIAYDLDMDHEGMECEYEKQAFDLDELNGWGSMNRGRLPDSLRGTPSGDTEDMQAFDMCPTCFQVMLDTALERAQQEPTSTDQQFGKLIPMRGVTGLRFMQAGDDGLRGLTMNLSRVGELGAVIGDAAIRSITLDSLEAARVQGEIERMPSGPTLVFPVARDLVDASGQPLVTQCYAINRGSQCRSNSVPGSLYCYVCAARGPL